MEDQNQSISSEHASCATAQDLPNSSTADDSPPPPPPSATADGGDEPKNKNNREDPDTPRESKRRKLCPSALEKCESIIMNSCANSSNGFSFTFDPKFSCGVSTPEVTPKFGSFNLGAAAEAGASSREEIAVKSEQEYELKEEEEDEEVKEKRKFLEIFGGSIDDGIGINADYFEEGSNLFL